ncbi:MAG: hypothetical protein WBB01_11925 [Phormidesmis sp.]
MIIKSSLKSLFLVLLLSGCAAQPPAPETPEARSSDLEVSELAIVRAVEVSGEPGAYTFVVTIESEETGCGQYANWWEVVTEDGTLLYRRILAHSHVDEQPFTRSGGPVAVEADQTVIVRSHMYPQGYSAQVVQGTVSEGWVPTMLPTDFALELAEAEPQPNGCAF